MKHYSVAMTQKECLIFLVDAENEVEAAKLAENDYENEVQPFDAFVEGVEITQTQECTDVEYNMDEEDFIKVRVHPKLKQEIRMLCAQKNRSMQDMINEILRREMRKI